ncbi:phage portal protein [Pumilibacter intestinalis]|uniref:phage portal protein n=1 Tax=Pumilibacter intestinalis TaxID=2941511 RepID=UPI00203F9F89|nr:phage portal protein [Pumilibacter intestinalis]
MGIFGRSRDAPKRERRNKPSKEMQDFIRGVDMDFIGNSNSGVQVDELRALQTSAVYACVKILAETVASLPLHLFKKGKGGKSEMAEQHPLFSCLYEMPNDEMTSFEFREMMMTSLLLWGNAYARKIRKNGHVTELWYLKPQLMTVERDTQTGRIKYTYSDDITNQTYEYKPEQIFHIKGLSLDGVTGLSPISQAREAVGLSLATEEYGAKFFGNGARPGGVLEHPGILKDPEKLRESWNKVYQGTRNSHKVAVLEEGMKYHTIGIAPEDAQFLETRKYQVNEICRIFRVPPHLVGDLERATFSNIEHQSIEFVQHTIRPWLVRWEQAISRSLLDEKERLLYFSRFNVDGLMRGDYKSRMEGYAIGRQNGWLSANDIRHLEDLPPIPKEQGGDAYLVNGNMTAVSKENKEGGSDGEGQKGIANAPDGGTANSGQ